MTLKIQVEVCCESLSDAKTAEEIGADRIELNAGLRLGGLTPSNGLTRLVCKQVGLPVIAMIRPRESGFCYSDQEFETMLADSDSMIECGVSGIAFGILTADGNIDLPRCIQLINIAKAAGIESVLHRAFDFVSDWRLAIEQCIEIGVDRIMTSGASANALVGVKRISDIVDHAGDRIQVLPAGGINPENVRKLVAESGCDQVHGSFSKTILDPSTAFFDDPLVDIERDAKSYRATCGLKTKDLIDELSH